MVFYVRVRYGKFLTVQELNQTLFFKTHTTIIHGMVFTIFL